MVEITRDPNINQGSPVGPGFVVYERAPGKQGYDLDLALASVGKGWHGLLRTLFEIIAFNSEHNPHLGYNDVVITQVKEKFGTLRIHYMGGSEHAEGFISAIEQMSHILCEDCGRPGVLRNSHSWRRTLCDECESMRDR